MTTTIYGLIDPRDELIHYVGKTNKASRRLIEHRNEHGRVNAKKTEWIDDMYADGVYPIMEVLETCEDEKADERELFWIAYGREEGWPLVNKAHGIETTARKIDSLIEKAIRLGLLPGQFPRAYLNYEPTAKKRLLPAIVEQAEEGLQRATDAANAARKLEAELESYLVEIEEFIHGPDYS